MDLASVIGACALWFNQDVMRAVVTEFSGGYPYTVMAEGFDGVGRYRDVNEAVSAVVTLYDTDARLRIGLAGIRGEWKTGNPRRIAGMFNPCLNLNMASEELHHARGFCKANRPKEDVIRCSVAVYRGTSAQPDWQFADVVVARMRLGETNNPDLSGWLSAFPELEPSKPLTQRILPTEPPAVEVLNDPAS